MAYLPHGTTVSIAAQDITGLVNVSLPERTKGDAETTDSASGGDRTYLPGIRDGGTFTLECRRDPDDQGQEDLRTNYENDQTVVEFIITLPAAATSASGSRTYTFDGYVNAISGDDDLIADEVAMTSYTVKVDGGVTVA